MEQEPEVVLWFWKSLAQPLRVRLSFWTPIKKIQILGNVTMHAPTYCVLLCFYHRLDVRLYSHAVQNT